MERNNNKYIKYSFKPLCNFRALTQTKITTIIAIDDKVGIIRSSNCLLEINFENKLCNQVEAGDDHKKNSQCFLPTTNNKSHQEAVVHILEIKFLEPANKIRP